MTVYYANVYYYYTDKISYAYSHPLHVVSGKASPQYTSDSEECDMGNSVSNCDRKRRGFLKTKGLSRVFKDKSKKCPGNENDVGFDGELPVFCDSACDYVNFKIGRSYSDFLYGNKTNIPVTNYDSHIYENTDFLFGFQQSIPEIPSPASNSGDASSEDESSDCTENYSEVVPTQDDSGESDTEEGTERCESCPADPVGGGKEYRCKQGADGIYYKQTSPDLLNAINDLDKQLDQEEIFNKIETVFSADGLPKDLLSSSFLSGSLYFSINEFHNTPHPLDEPYENVFFSCAGSQLDVRYEYDSDSVASTPTLSSNTELSSRSDSDVEQDYWIKKNSVCSRDVENSEDEFLMEQCSGLLSRSSSSSVEYFSVFDPTESDNSQVQLNWKKPPPIPKWCMNPQVHRSRSESAGRRRQLRPISLNDDSTSQESIHESPVRNLNYFWERAPPVAWKAEDKKNEGNEFYKSKNYRAALESYKEAIRLCPTCASYYSNRSACYMMLGKYSEALADARECIKLDPEFIKGYVRVGKCNIALGDANAAISILTRAAELQPSKAISDEMNNAQSLQKYLEELNKAIVKKDYRTAVFHIDRALEYAVACRSLKIAKAENLLLLQRFTEAQDLVNEILVLDNHNADAIYVRGLCLYYQDNQASALTHLKHVLSLVPDHKKARDSYKKAKLLKEKKDAGNEAFNAGKLTEAQKLYSEALTIDPTNKTTSSKLYFNRATVKSKLRQYEEAVEDCTQAINLNDKYIKAYIRRVKCYQSLDKHEEAVRDAEKLNVMDSRNHEYRNLLSEAKAQLRKSQRKDYFKILGVSKGASEDEIKKAYRKKALLHHPDRHSSATEKEKRDHEIKFKEIGEAYTVLSDPAKRAALENGQDIDDGCGFNGGFDPNELFREFFSHGSSNSTPFHFTTSFGGGGGQPFYSFQ